MRHITVSVLLSAALLSAGCSSLLSLHPIAAADQAVSAPSLAGTWTDEKGKDIYVVRESAPGVYEIRCDEVKLEAVSFTIAGARYLDIRPTNEYPFQVPGHALVRFWLDGNTLRWAFVDSDWIKARLAEKKLAAVTVDKTVVLTEPPAGLLALLASDGAPESAYDEVTKLVRM